MLFRYILWLCFGIDCLTVWGSCWEPSSSILGSHVGYFLGLCEEGPTPRKCCKNSRQIEGRTPRKTTKDASQNRRKQRYENEGEQ